MLIYYRTIIGKIPIFFSLFPMMPRHNLYKIQPDVIELCRKHNIPYVMKPMGQAFFDILT